MDTFKTKNGSVQGFRASAEVVAVLSSPKTSTSLTAW